MLLKLVTLASLANKFTTDSLSLQTQDHSLEVNCPCAQGWTGNDCSQLKFAPIADTPSAYTSGVYDPIYKTWGGNPLQTDTTEFWLGTTLPNPRGLGCWPNDSTCGIWHKDGQNKWLFHSMIGFGDLPGYNYNDVPWCHNFRASIEYKLANISDPSSAHKFALRFDAIFATPISKEIAKQKFQKAVINLTNGTGCTTSGWYEPFPKDQKNQGFMIAYRELVAQNYIDVLREVRIILLNDTYVPQVNGYNQGERVNTALKWLDLGTKLSKPYVNSVNPQPLIESADNMLGIVANSHGQYQKLLSYRFSQPAARFESIGILFMPADKYIWESNCSYRRGSEIKLRKHIEDPAFFKIRQCNKDRLVLILHDFNQCTKQGRLLCGSVMYHELGPNNDDLFTNKAKWTPTKFLYNGFIDGLAVRATIRQRPYLSFRNGTADKLWTGVIFADAQYPGASTNFPVSVLH